MTPTLQGMRLALLAATLTAGLAGPAFAAGASDPLLSGYGGPGDGEQALLGQTLILGAGGSRGTSAPSPEAIYAEPAAPVETPVAEDPAADPQPAQPSRRPQRPARRPANAGPRPTALPERSADAPASTTSAVGIGGPVAAPAPVDGRGALLIGAVALLLAALAVCARRLAVRAARARRPATLQPR